MKYEDFLKEKLKTVAESGFTPTSLNPKLFPFQRFIVERALRAGRYAVFADTGLGKSFMQLEWAYRVHEHTGRDVLILAPLAVVAQTVEESQKWGISLAGITITNYEQLDNLDASAYVGVVLDESSILKSFDGATKKKLVDAFAKTPYKLACTATPSPNDPEEIGNHAEWLNVMSRTEMLAMYFVHDAADTGEWRIKGHAIKHFWEFVSTWAVMLNNPREIGFPMDGYDLPPLEMIDHKIETESKNDGLLFNDAAVNATDFNAELRRTKVERLTMAAELANEAEGDVIIWIKQNEEGDFLRKLIPNAIEASGLDTSQRKVDVIRWFTRGVCLCQSARKGKDTTGNGINGTRNLSEITSELTLKREMNEDENNTEQTLKSEERLLNQQQMREMQTRNSTTSKDSDHITGFQSKITIDSLSPKMGSVQSAEGNQALSGLNKDYTSTTITRQESSEDCFALTAITPLESFKTESTYLKTQSCTCGCQGKKILIAKSRMFGYGVNMQNCHVQVFASLDFSFESLYQSIRRSYRFGQTKSVQVHLITTDTMTNVIEAVEEKQRKFKEMQKQMSDAMNANLRKDMMTQAKIDSDDVVNDSYTIRRGDCVPLIKDVESDSVGFCVHSPPFADLFVYSSHIEDMGNCKEQEDFIQQYKYLIKELYRVLKPGRNVAVHCMDLPTQKGRHGHIGIRDFSGLIREAYEECGFIYHSRITIWKDPVTAMQRTKALGLLHKTIRKDSTMSRVGIPDNVLIFRKDGDRDDPVWHYGSYNEAVNAIRDKGLTDEQKAIELSRVFDVELWQKYASPIWMDIDQGDTLNGKSAREEEDERHLCPLQLPVIHRLIHLYTNPGDIVLTPFMGIGSEVYKAVEMGRRGIGFELKEAYFQQAKKNLESVTLMKKQEELF